MSVTILLTSSLARSLTSWPAMGESLAPNSIERVGGARGGVSIADLIWFEVVVRVSGAHNAKCG